MQTLKKFLYLLSSQERTNVFLLILMILFMAFLEMIGVASIMPFMAFLANPSLIETNTILKSIFEASNIIGVESKQQFLFFLGILVFTIFILTLTFKGFTVYFQTRFVKMREYTIGKRLVESYLRQPYKWYLDQNSANLEKTILSDVGQVVTSGLMPIVELIAKSTVIIAILILLIFASPKISLISGGTLAVSYTLIYLVIRKYVKKIGEKRLKANELRFTTLSEVFGAIKDVKIGRLEKNYIKRFSDPAFNYSRHNVSVMTLSSLPRYIIEGLAFGGILLIIIAMMSKVSDISEIIPILAVYLFAGYRLLPAFQSVFASLNQMRFINATSDVIYNDLKKIEPIESNNNQEKLEFNRSIILKNIFFNYSNSKPSRKTLENINININSKTTVGFVGTTGSGKTTLVDLILGLLVAQSGSIEVDGKILTKNNLRAWQKIIGYVPQNIYLADDTISANIAFGQDLADINQKSVEKAAKIASIDEFITNELPKKYQTKVGERGIRLSGGQRQRIGIARALYHNPKLLILDEATSALDNTTEKIVMDAVNKLSKDITIILIAHRLSTVKTCDEIFLLEKGKITNQGSFDELLKKDKSFQESVFNK